MSEPTDCASPAMLREVARNFDASAEFCDSRNPAYPDLAARDRGIAASLRYAAAVTEAAPLSALKNVTETLAYLQGEDWETIKKARAAISAIEGSGDARPQ